MNAVARAFPAAHTLAIWWRQLAPLQPHALWVAELTLHRVDALVCVDQPCQADPLSRQILQTLAATPTVETLEQRTGLPRQFLHQALVRLRAEGLLATDSWQLSAAGRQAFETGAYARPRPERRTFHFRARTDAPPPFIPVRGGLAEPCLPAEGWNFDIAILDDWLQRPREWKSRYGFPTDVTRVDAPGAIDWRHVAVDTPARLSLALVRVGTADDLLGIACTSAGKLDTGQPVFTLGSIASEVFPETGAPRPEVCATAWREWCRGMGWTDTEADECGLELQGTQLTVRGGGALADRLRALKEEAWLLIGSGEVRQAAHVVAQT